MVKQLRSAHTTRTGDCRLKPLQRLMLDDNGDEPIRHFITDSRQEEPIELPAVAVAVLSDVLKFMSRGHGLTLFPRLAEVTTMEAADILSVSRPYVIKLLEEGEIPYRLIGKPSENSAGRCTWTYDAESQRRKAARQWMRSSRLSQELGLYD